MFNTSLGSLVQLSTPLLANSSYMNKGTSDPLVKQTSPLKFRIASGRLQQWRRKMSSSVCLSEGKYRYDLYATQVGMVFARGEAL